MNGFIEKEKVMGWKYSIHASLNGFCKLEQGQKTTRYFIVALFWLIVFSIKYPIVDFMVRNGYKDCNSCQYEGLLCGREFKHFEEAAEEALKVNKK
jgi:hypothetical protein